VVADELVFGDARRYRNDLLAQPQDNDYNKCLCSTAYRQYILWGKCTHWSRHHGSYPLLFCMADQGQVFRHYWTIFIVDTFTHGSRQQENSSLLLCLAVNQETIQDIYFFNFVLLYVI